MEEVGQRKHNMDKLEWSIKVPPSRLIQALGNVIGHRIPTSINTVDGALHYAESLDNVVFPFDTMEDMVVVCYDVTKALSEFYAMVLAASDKRRENKLLEFITSYDLSSYILCYDSTFGKGNNLFLITGNERSIHDSELDNPNTIVASANLADFGLVHMVTLKSYIKESIN